MKTVKTTENERYVKPEVKDITSLSDGLVLHGEGTAEGIEEDENVVPAH